MRLRGCGEGHLVHLSRRSVADHELLEVAPAGVGADAGVELLVAHRQHARAHADRLVQPGERLGGAQSLILHAAALQAPREVAVAEVEPHVDAERPQGVHHRERVVAQMPQPRSSMRSASQNDTRSGSGETWAP